MTAPVDVLAVMDADGRAVACVVDECQSARRAEEWKAHMVKHDQARAAVAELISAARDYADVEENAYDSTQTIPARKRLRAALVGVGGAK